MAEPTDGVLIWAFQDVTLPNAGTINKIKPIDDLINKGWDRTQKPAAQEFNYVLNNHGQWIEYLRTSFIAGTPNNIPDTLVKRDSLGNFSATTITASLDGNALTADEADHALTADLATNATNAVTAQTAGRWSTARTLTLTGAVTGSVSWSGSANASLTTSFSVTPQQVSVITGFVSSGGTIPLPSGYTEAQCRWMASLRSIDATNDLSDLYVLLSGRVVTVKAEASESVTNASAWYICIGVK